MHSDGGYAKACPFSFFSFFLLMMFHLLNPVPPGKVLETNAFLIPRVGGVVIDPTSSINISGTSNVHLSKETLKPILQIFAQQLRGLLGILPFKWSEASDLVRVLDRNRVFFSFLSSFFFFF
jgi:hypothetical protein